MENDSLATELLHTLKASIKRLYIVIIIIILLLFGSNMAWLYAWNLPSEASDTTISQDSEDNGTNNFIGNDDDINGETSN